MFRRYFKEKHLIFSAVILILKFNYHEFNTNVNQRFYRNVNTSSNLFRFRDFEPRYTMQTDTDIIPTLVDGLVHRTRKSRGFQFHADDKDISIELEFIVPFVRIPIERSMMATKTAFSSLFNLNFQSLLTTGAIVAVGGVFAIILKGLFSPFVHINEYKKNIRSDDTGEVNNILNPFLNTGNVTKSIPNVNQFATILESKLLENNINVSHCIQKSVCSYVQKSIWDVNSEKESGGFQKIIDGVISLDLVRNYLSGTAIQQALDAAKYGENCDIVYRGCNWSFPTKKILNLLIKNLNYLNGT